MEYQIHILAHVYVGNDLSPCIFSVNYYVNFTKKQMPFFYSHLGGFGGGIKILSPSLPDFIVCPKMSQTIIMFFLITQKVIVILAYSLWHMKAKVLGFKVQHTRYGYLCYF